MYYYIMEPAGRKDLVWQEKVRNILGDLGIAGETVTPSPARTIEELTTLGIAKGYSTIVAVGSEKLVNKVATAIINQKEAGDVVLGMIPSDYTGPLAKKIRVGDIKDACNALKHRKLQTIDACFIEPNKYFLTEAVIGTNHPVDAYLITSQIKAGLSFNKITIKPGLKIYIDDEESQTKKSLFGWFSKPQTKDIYSSFFHSKKVQIETLGATLPVVAEGEVISKTPIVCENKQKALKIIVARDIIEEAND